MADVPQNPEASEGPELPHVGKHLGRATRSTGKAAGAVGKAGRLAGRRVTGKVTGNEVGKAVAPKASEVAKGASSKAVGKSATEGAKQAARSLGKKASTKVGTGNVLGSTGNKTNRQMEKVNKKREAKGKAPKKQGLATTAANTALTKGGGAAITAATAGFVPPSVANKLAAVGVRNKKKVLVLALLTSTPVPLMLIVLVLIFALGFAGLPSFAITPSSEAVSQIKSNYLNAYQQAANTNEVPWTILAAIGQITTQNGTVNPYASATGTTSCPGGGTVSGQAECSSFPETVPAIVPTAGSSATGVGPMMIDQNAFGIQNYAASITGGNPQSVQGSIDAVAKLLAKDGQAVAQKNKISYQDMLTKPLDKESQYWAQAIAALPISVGDDCLPSSSATAPGATPSAGGAQNSSNVASSIEYVFSCEATTATNLSLGVGNGVTIPTNAAQNQIIAEGLEVSWAYSKMGSASGNCNPFPIPANTTNADCNAAPPTSQGQAQLNNIRATAQMVIANSLTPSGGANGPMSSTGWSVVPGAVVPPPTPSTPAATTAPSNLSATQSDGSITINWTPATDFSGAPVASYAVSTSNNKGCTAQGASATSCTVTGLTNGTNYTFTVKAKNASGALSSPTLIGPITPSATPVVDATSSGWGPAAPPTQVCEGTLLSDLNNIATNPFSPITVTKYGPTWSAGPLEALRQNTQGGCYIPSQAANSPGQMISEQRWELIVLTTAYQVLGQRWVSQGAQVSEGGLQTLISYLDGQLHNTPYALKAPAIGQTSLLTRQSNPTVDFSLPLSGQDGATQLIPLAPVPVGTTGFASSVVSTAEGYDTRTAGSVSNSGSALACGPMTEYTWAALVMQDAGIAPTTANTTDMAVWITQENPITDWYRAGSNNPLNVNRSGAGSDSTPNLTFSAKDTAAVLKQPNMANVFSALKSSSVKSFSVAITTSNWAQSHYRVDTHDPSVPLPNGVQPWSGPLDTMAPPFDYVPGRLDTYMAAEAPPAPVVAPASAVGAALPACTGATGSAATLISAALSMYTQPYASAQGPAGVAGFDCSGLVDWSLLQAGGMGLPGNLGGGAKSGTAANAHGITTEGMASLWADKVLPAGAQPQPGDIVLYFNLDGDNAWDHVALYIGNGQAVAETGPTGSPGSVGPYTWPGATTEIIHP